MAKFIIEGGRPLRGEVTPSGNKNEALPALMACLLTDETVTLQNLPQIGDVMTVCDVLRNLGASADWVDATTLEVNASGVTKHDPEAELCSRVRASILLLGPLLARLGKIVLPLPGGDIIGARRIDTHWEGAVKLGASLRLENGGIVGECARPKGSDIFLDEPSVTATENLLLMSVLAEGETILHNAACEPHVVGLCRQLNAMGAKISGIGSNRIVIDGVSKLSGAKHRISSDFMEVGSFLCLGAITKGDITIKDVKMDDYRFILKTLKRIGVEPHIGENEFVVSGPPQSIQPDIGGRVGTIYSGPWPAYPTDLMSVSIVAATQAPGTVIFFEKMFEGRMFFTDKLMAMGAGIVLCDPHRIVCNGPSQLLAARMSSPDVRAGMAMLIASLVAKGTSEIENIYQIERGYERIGEKLEALGAAIKRVD